MRIELFPECPTCKGKGSIDGTSYIIRSERVTTIVCKNCFGTGLIDLEARARKTVRKHKLLKSFIVISKTLSVLFVLLPTLLWSFIFDSSASSYLFWVLFSGLFSGIIAALVPAAVWDETDKIWNKHMQEKGLITESKILIKSLKINRKQGKRKRTEVEVVHSEEITSLESLLGGEKQTPQ